MPQHHRRLSLADAALVVALVPVFLLPELLGGVHPQVATGAAVCELAALALVVVERARRGSPLRASWLGAPIALGLVFTILEWLPMPRAVASLLQPVGTSNVAWVTSLLPDEARVHVRTVLSLDPPETAFAAVRLAGALALFLVVTETCRHRRARELAYRLLIATGAAMFLVALGHQLLHVQGAWGRFTMKTTFFYAPMVNPNQLARIFGAVSLACAAWALVARSRLELVWAVGTSVCCGAGVFLTLSRGGMLAFVAGGFVLAFLLWRERREPEEREGRSRLVGIALAQLVVFAAIALGLFLARETILREAASLETDTVETSKLALYRPALALLSDYGRVGTGNNAFGVAFMTHAAPNLFGGGLTFTNAENIVINTIVEHGAVTGGLILLSALAVGAALLAGARTRTAFAPLPALAFLLVGDLFDFALESTAGIYVAALLLGLAAAALIEEPRFAFRVRNKGAAALTAGLAIVVAVTAVPAIRWSRRSLDTAISDAEGEARAPLIERALAAHPADAQYCYLLAVEARARRDARLALKWANRALVLWPTHRGAHIEAARALAATGRVDQALGEYKAAFVDGPPDMRIVREIALRTGDLEKLRRALPDNVAAAGMLAQLLVAQKRLGDAQTVLDHAATLPEATPYVRRRAVEVALLRKDTAGAEQRLQPLMKGARVDASVVTLLLTAIAQEDERKAFATSKTWENRVSDEKTLLRWQVGEALKLGELDEASAIIDKLRRRAGDATSVDWLDRQEAELHRRRGDNSRALHLLERVAARAPRDVALQVELAQMQIALGLLPEAKVTLMRLPPGPTAAKLEAQIDGAEQGARERRMRALVEGR